MGGQAEPRQTEVGEVERIAIATLPEFQKQETNQQSNKGIELVYSVPHTDTFLRLSHRDRDLLVDAMTGPIIPKYRMYVRRKQNPGGAYDAPSLYQGD